jgi:hypothetical protein
MVKITDAAQVLLERRLNLKDGPRLDEYLRPRNNGEAFAMQTEVSRLLRERNGDEVGGWKCLIPSEGKLVVGPIYRSTIHRESPCPVLPLNDAAVIEPEIAFVMGKTLAPADNPYTEAEILAAIAETRLALELIKSRYADPSQCAFPELLADSLFNQGLFLGPGIDRPAPASLAINLVFDRQEKRLAGRHPNGDAYGPLVWLANFLRVQGIALTEGQAVITGSYAGVLEVPFEQEIEVGFENLGAFRLVFAELA